MSSTNVWLHAALAEELGDNLIVLHLCDLGFEFPGMLNPVGNHSLHLTVLLLDAVVWVSFLDLEAEQLVVGIFCLASLEV